MNTTFNGSKILAKEFEGELWIKASDINLAAKAAPTPPCKERKKPNETQ